MHLYFFLLCLCVGIILLSIVEFSKEDMAKSLLHMISNDIGQLACLYAKLHNLSRVYFGGFFIRGHPVTMHTITYSINFFTKARKRLLLANPVRRPCLFFCSFSLSELRSVSASIDAFVVVVVG